MNLTESKKIKDLIHSTADKGRGLVDSDGMSAIIIFLMLWAKLYLKQNKK